MDRRYTITEAARTIGVRPETIKRWERAGKIPTAKRDWRNWRVYVEQDIQVLRDFYDSTR